MVKLNTANMDNSSDLSGGNCDLIGPLAVVNSGRIENSSASGDMIYGAIEDWSIGGLVAISAGQIINSKAAFKKN